jgi:hypothetical protein
MSAIGKAGAELKRQGMGVSGHRHDRRPERPIVVESGLTMAFATGGDKFDQSSIHQ